MQASWYYWQVEKRVLRLVGQRMGSLIRKRPCFKNVSPLTIFHLGKDSTMEPSVGKRGKKIGSWIRRVKCCLLARFTTRQSQIKHRHGQQFTLNTNLYSLRIVISFLFFSFLQSYIAFAAVSPLICKRNVEQNS